MVGRRVRLTDERLSVTDELACESVLGFGLSSNKQTLTTYTYTNIIYIKHARSHFLAEYSLLTGFVVD